MQDGPRVEAISKGWILDMGFPQRLHSLRKSKGLTQQGLADEIGSSVIQVHRYEAGSSQPTLDVIRKLAIALEVTADELVFDSDERGPSDELKLQFEAVSSFDPEALKVAKEVLDSLILKQQAKRWVG